MIIRKFLPNVYQKLRLERRNSLRNIGQSSLSLQNSSSSSLPTKNDGEKIRVHYITKSGEKITVYGNEGDNLMHLAHRNGIEIEGACEASLACCTCHVYVNYDHFDKLPEADEEEQDLLDMAPFLKENSRLSCQIILTKDLEDIEATLPPATRNFYVDDKKPTQH